MLSYSSSIYNYQIAFKAPQFSNALLPLTTPSYDPTGYLLNQGYPMWLQTLFTPIATLHHSLYALGGLDI